MFYISNLSYILLKIVVAINGYSTSPFTAASTNQKKTIQFYLLNIMINSERLFNS